MLLALHLRQPLFKRNSPSASEILALRMWENFILHRDQREQYFTIHKVNYFTFGGAEYFTFQKSHFSEKKKMPTGIRSKSEGGCMYPLHPWLQACGVIQGNINP